MDSGQAGLPEERVRRALRHLGADADSAPPVPPGVTARIAAALRAAPPAHADRPTPRIGRLRIIGMIIGIGATAAAIVCTAMLVHSSPPTPAFPKGPTAERMTVPVTRVTPDTPKAVVTPP
ncbi:hypothetical protein [Mycolicibacterium stellerae]|uniref:hypothetical protein n=1 Tax=Mycolicibacterium stellerae TaxID=2358193 RepID=UPI000F0B2FDC|nr:hypothetical protein [Mycolicibacterium stellerae]